MSLHSLPLQISHSARLLVTSDLTVPEVSRSLPAFSDMPGVLATAYMVAFAEAACIECIAPYRLADEHTVGTHVDISHVSATPPGLEIFADVRLTEVAGRLLKFEVALRDSAGPIGHGRHERAIISTTRFERSVREKASSGGIAV